MKVPLGLRAASRGRCWVMQWSVTAEKERPLVGCTFRRCRRRQLLALMAMLRCYLLRPREGQPCCCLRLAQCTRRSWLPGLTLRCWPALWQGTW
jgi:hypothetical protein